MSTAVVTKTPIRVAFPALKEPKSFQGSKPKFSVIGIFDPDSPELERLKAAGRAAAQDKWGKNIPEGIFNPIKTGKSYAPNKVVCKFASEFDVGVVDRNAQDILDKSDVYSGCYCNVSVKARAYGGGSSGFNPGIAFDLRHVQLIRDGERIGSSSPQDDFAPYDPSADDPGSYATDGTQAQAQPSTPSVEDLF